MATAAFLPLEIHEPFKTVTVTKVAALVINVVSVVYLVVAKRLFGVSAVGPQLTRARCRARRLTGRAEKP